MFRIHWKGCPHRHLPRIRLPSWRSSVTRSRLAQEAFERVNLLPFSSALRKAREKERIKARRRRARSRIRSDETTLSIKALRDIEIFGWDSPRHLDTLGIENQKSDSQHPDSFGSAKKYQVIESIDRIPHGLVEYSGNRPRPHMDGGASSRTSEKQAENRIPRERRFTPAYWNRTGTGRDTKPSYDLHREDTFGKNRISGAYLPHLSTTEPTQTVPTATAPTPALRTRNRSVRIPIKRVPTKGVPITNAPSRTYDPRIPIKKAPPIEVHQRVTKTSPTSSKSPGLSRKVSIVSRGLSRSSKRRGWTSPEFRSALSSVISQKVKPGTDGKADTSDIDATEPSRTSTEQRAIERFTLELAKSLANPEKLRRSPQESTEPSIHTVQDLKPYASQFRAAGLSVSFQDQVLTTPHLRQVNTPVKKADDLSYNLKTFSFEKRKTGLANMQKPPAKKPAFDSGTPTDFTDSSASSWGEGHHHLQRAKAKAVPEQNIRPAPTIQLPTVPPRPAIRKKTVIEIVDPKTDKPAPSKAAPAKAAPARSPSDFTSSSASMSWTAGHHHVRAVKQAQAAKQVAPKQPNSEMTPTPAPRRAPTTKVVPPSQLPRKSIPWLQPVQTQPIQTGEMSPKGKSVATNDFTSWQDKNIISPETMTTTDSSFVTVIDWSPIEDPRANLAIYPLITRPTEVEWIELNYEQGQGSTSGPTVRVVDMKKRPAWESAEPVTSVEVMPIEEASNARNNVRRKTVAGATADSVERPLRASPALLDRSRPMDIGKELSAMIVPVNVISITPVSSVYSFKRTGPEKPLLCVRCGRLLMSPTPNSPPPPDVHDCTRKSSLCADCAPSKTRPVPPVDPPSPTEPAPPIVPIRALRRTGTLFKSPPIAPSSSTETSDSRLNFEGFSESFEHRQANNVERDLDIIDDVLRPVISVPPTIEERELPTLKPELPETSGDTRAHELERERDLDIIDDVLRPVLSGPPVETEQENRDPAPRPTGILNTDFPPTTRTKIHTPIRMPPIPLPPSSRASVDTIIDIISHYSPAESTISQTTLSPSDKATNPISDKDVFRGLQIVTLAACDKNVDTWIKDMSGVGVRKFLADVGRFEKLGLGEVSRLARRTARRRRREEREREREMGRVGQGDGIGEGSSDGSSTVRGWKGVDELGGRGGMLALEPECHVSGPEVVFERREGPALDSEQGDGDGGGPNEWCKCDEEEEKVDKGKGEEKEKEVDGRSRRDRFGFRDGHFH